MSGAAARSLVIEFMGLPGVGKTTIAVHVARELARRGIPVHVVCESAIAEEWPPTPRAQKLRSVLLEVLTAPGEAARWLRIVRQTRQRTVGDSFRILLRWLLLARWVHRRGSGVLVWDQGLAQALWSMLFRAQTPETVDNAVLEHIRAMLPGRGLLVWIGVDQQVWRERLTTRERPGSRLERYRTRPDWDDELQRAWSRMEDATGYARRLASDSSGALDFLAIDNTERDCWNYCVDQVVAAALTSLD